MQTDIRMLIPGAQNGQRRHRVESEGSAAQKTAIPLCVNLLDGFVDPRGELRTNLR